MRVFKWSPTFTPEQESSITPIWVSFPELPAHLYRKDALFAIANNIGTPLQIADSTLNQSNLAKARVCVEIYLLKPLLKEIDLKICGATIVHNIVYEHIPNYCSLCKHVGHRDAECYSKGDAPKPPPHRQIFGKNAAERYKLKWKAVAQDVYKVLDKIPEKTEVGECSKNTVDHHRYVFEAVLNSQKEIVDAENDDFVAENGVFDAENDNSVAENDSIRVMEIVVELDGNDNDGNDTLDGETINVACGGGPVGDCNNIFVIEADFNCGKNYMHEDNVNAENDILDCENIGFACGIEEKNVRHPTENENEIDRPMTIKDNALNTGEKAVGIMITRPNNIIGDLRRGKRWISADTAFRPIQNLKRFGVVIKGIKEDVEEVIQRNRLAVSSAIRF
ncbi:UNVERIFIED_CONTAM: hypothetical protein Sradi_0062600 [Sesamum radiatum]|uniref:DUF4283 domain-containing protein n=1 Tax=Sesamum radiatum TaxID=300843 RepID=A0AAW2WHE2_SESRA